MTLFKALVVLFCALLVGLSGPGNPLQAAEKQPPVRGAVSPPPVPSIGPPVYKLDCDTKWAHTKDPMKTPAGTFQFSPIEAQATVKNASTVTIPAGTIFYYNIEWVVAQQKYVGGGTVPTYSIIKEPGSYQLKTALPPMRQVVFMKQIFNFQEDKKPKSCWANIPVGQIRPQSSQSSPAGIK